MYVDPRCVMCGNCPHGIHFASFLPVHICNSCMVFSNGQIGVHSHAAARDGLGHMAGIQGIAGTKEDEGMGGALRVNRMAAVERKEQQNFWGYKGRAEYIGRKGISGRSNVVKIWLIGDLYC